MKKRLSIIQLFMATLSIMLSNNIYSQHYKFRDCNLSIDERANDLLNALTLAEKISLLGYSSPAVERLQIPSYNWWNEGLHGVARAGQATVYPQAIALAATFDPELVNKVADAISTEARAKHNMAIAKDKRLQYLGINFWTPNINIFRDPRWGRGQETYGEDPFLTGIMGTAFVKGLQGDDPNRYKISACAKHFAAHSGPEAIRHEFNAIVDEKDLRETYLPAFKVLVDNGVSAIMCGYNRLNDQPCCTSENLLETILTKEWQFDGQITTDCWALDDIWLRHKSIPTRVGVAAAAIKQGVNMDCSPILQQDAMEAIEKGLITEDDINNSIYKTLITQIKLGFYDDPCESPYTTFGPDSINNAYHVDLSIEAAEKSMVLLKNDGILPLDKSKTGSMMVLGENAANISVLVGNYHGMSGNMVTYAEGLVKKAGPGTAVQYDFGCSYSDTTHFGGIWGAGMSDVSVVVLGLTPLFEGEEGDAFLSPSGGDKEGLSLPEAHLMFLKKLRASHNKPIIAVLTAGSALDVEEVAPYADAIIYSWYSGEQGGTALANIIYGDVSPSGKLPLTFYKSLQDLPEYTDYNMANRTYRYFGGEVAYPFGFGLSYTNFDYTWLSKPNKTYKKDQDITFKVKVSNTGDYNGDDVIQVYIEYPNLERMPLKELKAFKRAGIKANQSTDLTFTINTNDLQKWDLKHSKWQLYKGEYKILVSKNSAESVLEHSFIIK
nr:glycoside hydrolase family 3 N-terminal domain-containing protein [uncultured Carboxylicivirga sp.]